MSNTYKRGSNRKILEGLFPDRYVTKTVHIVCGAPGSGKTTYVQMAKSDDDLVVDLDYLCAALNATSNIYQNHESVLGLALRIRDEIYKYIEAREGKWENAWVITASADDREVQQLAARLRADVTVMQTTYEQCIENIRRDTRRKGKEEQFVMLADKWYKNKD